jgi:hypothetical protein
MLSSLAEFGEILADYRIWREQFCDERGELLPRFQPAPLEASFMAQDQATLPGAIPVPKGPVEVW